MYPGGREERAADIAAGRGASARMVLGRPPARVRLVDGGLERTARRRVVGDRVAWCRARGRSLETVDIRRREVEVHHVDLGTDYTPVDWPVAFVGSTLDDAMETLPARAAPHRPNVHAR